MNGDEQQLAEAMLEVAREVRAAREEQQVAVKAMRERDASQAETLLAVNALNARASIERLVGLVGLAVIGLLIAGLVVSSVLQWIQGSQVRHLSAQNHELSRQNQLGVQRIIDCTTKGHPCYDANAKQSGVLIGQLNAATAAATARAAAAAEWCAERDPKASLPALVACVTAHTQR